MHRSSTRASLRGQLSLPGLVIGIVGCVIITSSSVYTALKMGALPWPTIFTSIVSLLLLRAFGRRSLNEVNITQIIMSAGSMVAGGLAFTLPAAWMLGYTEMGWVQILGVALAGTLLGLVVTALIRRRFVDESDLEYPIGVAAAETLHAGAEGGKVARQLFGAMGISGAWCALRDAAGAIPTLLFPLNVPGASVAIYNSPMLVAVGFLLGGVPALFWLMGAVAGNVGIPVATTALGWCDAATASGVVSSLGMGLMMGSGLGVVLKDILPSMFRHMGSREACVADAGSERPTYLGRFDAGTLALLVAAAVLTACILLRLPVLVCVALVALSFVTAIMSAQSVGRTGIDPMEIFGLIALLGIAAVSQVGEVKLFYIAGVVAVACGLAGDVMSDFKTGAIIGTSPRAMWCGQALGALVGTVVAAGVMVVLVQAYGPEAFGPGREFVSAQASVVATMVSGIPSPAAFGVGLVAGIALYAVGVPAMMLGLGVYLPFYMSITACIGAGIKLVHDRVRRARGSEAGDEAGTIVASGVLGGESIIGVLIALASVAGFLS